MSKAKEFFDYCVKNADTIKKLRGMKSYEIIAYVKSLGFELNNEDLREFVELCAESNDEKLAEAISGGICTSHCGATCERESACTGSDFGFFKIL